jgi:DHA1 family bicyclomycin/chloramphenicol resistance-like MFS transporter
MQGLSTGAGIVVARAVVRDMFDPTQAQKVMSQITIYFGVAPAIAPIIGGWLFVHLGWHSVFWFLTGVGVTLWIANYKLLPETLHLSHRQPLKVSNLMQGYVQLGRDPRFFLLALASGVPFNGMFLYVLSAPAFLGDHLALAPTQFFWFFILTISGIMGGAWVSGRMAGKLAPKQQIRYGFLTMLTIGVVNLVANVLFKADVRWSLFPIAIFSFGWALMVPVVTLLVLDLHPERRGMASSLQAFIAATANGLVAGVIAPLVMHSTVALAAASLAMMSLGLVSWIYLHHRWPDIGRTVAHPDPAH